VALLARILGNAGNPITQSDITSIAWTARDLNTGVTISTGTFTVATSVYNSLQQSDGRWTVDSQYAPGHDRRWGYNFAGTVPAATFANLFDVDPLTFRVTLHRVQVTVAFTPASGEPFRQAFQFSPLATW
jgi:hypothetical protein